jgi:hypothetical protein
MGQTRTAHHCKRCGSSRSAQVDICRAWRAAGWLGDRLGVRIPALSDRRILVEVNLIPTKGEYASWQASRATGDFDLRTLSIRLYPIDKVPDLRPGMSAYLEWRERE